MEDEKHKADSSPDRDSNNHVEALQHEQPRDINDPAYVDHRADDDRANEAMGRNANKFEKKYWLSVNYIGTLFAIGMAFVGGIGGYGLIAPVLNDINEDIGPSP